MVVSGRKKSQRPSVANTKGHGSDRIGQASCFFRCPVLRVLWWLARILGKGGVGFLPNSRTPQILTSSSGTFHTPSALAVHPGPFTFPSTSCSVRGNSPGKDARLFVFRLSAVQRGVESKQAARSRCDCRENKLEKTKGDSVPRASLAPSCSMDLVLRLPRFY